MNIKHKQHGNINCGVFAIAYAVDLALGSEPEEVAATEYVQPKMRKHLEESFHRGYISPFPRQQQATFETEED